MPHSCVVDMETIGTVTADGLFYSFIHNIVLDISAFLRDSRQPPSASHEPVTHRNEARTRTYPHPDHPGRSPAASSASGGTINQNVSSSFFIKNTNKRDRTDRKSVV